MKTFDNVADLKLAKLQPSQFINTGGYLTKGGSGSAKYFIKTAAQATTDGDVIDGFGNHTLANGNVAILQTSIIIQLEQWGAVNTVGVDNAPGINAALSLVDGNYSTVTGNGIFEVTTILPKANTTISDVSFKSVGNGGSSSPISAVPVIRIGDNINQLDNVLLDNVHVDGNRAAYLNIDILAGGDGGMHGLHIRGFTGNITARDCSFNFSGTAGIALDMDTNRDDPDSAPPYRIRDINIVRCDMNDNREHGSFAAYCQRVKYIDCNALRNGIDLPGGPFAEEDGRHGAFILANGFFGRGIDIEEYNATSGFTKVEIIGGEYSGNANGALQFFSPVAVGGNRVAAAHNAISNVITGPPTVGLSVNTINIQAGNPLASVYGMNGMYINGITLQGTMRINGVSGLNITGSQLGTTDPIRSIEVFNCRRISTNLAVTSELLLNDIEDPVIAVELGSANPVISSKTYTQSLGGVSRVTYKIFATGGGVAGTQNKLKFTWTNGLPITVNREQAIYSRLHLDSITDPTNFSPVVVDSVDGEVHALIKGTGDNLTFYLTVNVISGLEL